MDPNPALDADIDVTDAEAADVKGGASIVAGASAGGINVRVDNGDVSASGRGVAAHSKRSGHWDASAQASGQSAKAGGTRPTGKLPRGPLMP